MSNDSYLGASDAEKIYPENTVDYLKLVTGVYIYYLTQDVPGGHESNVLVIRNGVVLRPEYDYAIDTADDEHGGKNTKISFNPDHVAPWDVDHDQVYVVHKGVATYTFAPSPGSVTDDSLCENLRFFVFNSFTGNGTTRTWTLTKPELGGLVSRSFLVYVNGAVQRPYMLSTEDPGFPVYPTLPPGTDWDFYVYTVYPTPGDESIYHSDIVFRVAPANNATIGILYLAFSTVLRRSDYLTDVVLEDEIIKHRHIGKNAVDDYNILLNNDKNLRAKETDWNELTPDDNVGGLVKLNTNNAAEVFDTITVDDNKIAVTHRAGNVTHNNITVGPRLTETIDIGEDPTINNGRRFRKVWAKDCDLSNDLNVHHNVHIYNDLTVDGDVNFNGTINVADGVPIGVFTPSLFSVAGNVPEKWLLCDGSIVTDSYPNQYAGYRTFVNNNCAAALRSGTSPNFVYRTPDMRQRIPLDGGVTGSESLGATGGSFQHTHTIADHYHNLTPSNIHLIDNDGHTHGPGATIGGFTVTVPAHTHYLNEHQHTVAAHQHPFSYTHVHNVYGNTGNQSRNHNHELNWKRYQDMVLMSDADENNNDAEDDVSPRICVKNNRFAAKHHQPGGYRRPTFNTSSQGGTVEGTVDQTKGAGRGYTLSTSYDDGNQSQDHTHHFDVWSDSDGHAGIQNWGRPNSNDTPANSGKKLTDIPNTQYGYISTNGTQNSTTYSYNRTRFNNWNDDDLNPGNMSVPTNSSLVAHVAGTSSTAYADISVRTDTVSKTETKTGLTAAQNTAGSQPYLVCNYIIKVIA
jgi:hypothetical protein